VGQLVPGARYAGQIIHPGSPILRIRYRYGVVITPYGLPDWTPYATRLVRLPEPPADLGRDELRVVDVLAANRHCGWALTPDGWTWAHMGMSRQLALVPVELHSAFRHAGGLSTLGAFPGANRPGLRLDPPAERIDPPAERITVTGEELVPEPVMSRLEEHLGYSLPPAYRAFLARTNGPAPDQAAVHPRHGFLFDQRMFGIGRTDRHQDVIYADACLRDRLSTEFLAIGYVHGGLLAVRVAGPDAGSVWFWDADDPRADDRHTAEHICAELLSRCAADIDAFWTAIARPARELRQRAAELVVTEVRHPDQGSALGQTS
jgi:hypothetical protein